MAAVLNQRFCFRFGEKAIVEQEIADAFIQFWREFQNPMVAYSVFWGENAAT